LYPANENPWHYLPHWIGVTTPVWTMLLFIGGTIASIYNLFYGKTEIKLSLILLLLIFYIPLIITIVIKPVLFDGWRHFQFLVIPMILISGVALDMCLKNKNRWISIGAIVMTFISISHVGYQMIKLHPYQYIYFNQLTGGLSGAFGRYETDYWGKSNKEAIEWLKNKLKENQQYFIKTEANIFSNPYYFSENMKTAYSFIKADYYICYTRGFRNLFVDNEHTIHIVERMGVPLNYVKVVQWSFQEREAALSPKAKRKDKKFRNREINVLTGLIKKYEKSNDIFLRGLHLFGNRDYRRAIADFNIVLNRKDFPNKVDAHFFSGMAYFYLSESRLAKRNFRELIRLNPTIQLDRLLLNSPESFNILE
jgi:hypothetical protein